MAFRGSHPYGRSEPTQRLPRIVGDVANVTADDHPALASTLLRGLQERRKDLVDQLILAKDWPDFEKRRGLIHGVDEAIALCEQTQKRLEA